MARSEEAAAWTAAVYNAVREVPHGKVTSYGHIARLLGKRELRISQILTYFMLILHLAECPRLLD